MNKSIGIWVGTLGCLTILIDLALVATFNHGVFNRVALVLLGLTVVARQTPQGLGFQVRLNRAQFWAGLSGVAFVVLTAVLLILQKFYPNLVEEKEPLPYWALWMGLYFPLIEELLYRVILCRALSVWFGKWAQVLLSGAAFMVLHYFYGSLAWDNALAGFLLAWVYVTSGSFWIPLLWHSVGNLLIYILMN